MTQNNADERRYCKEANDLSKEVVNALSSAFNLRTLRSSAFAFDPHGDVHFRVAFSL